MADQSSTPGGSRKAAPLAERLRHQVDAASAELSQRPGVPEDQPRRNGRGAHRSSRSSLAGSLPPDQRALRAVFRQLGGTYRRHRRETGEAVFAPLRSAALAFRQEPSFNSLLPVAALMDELALLKW